MIKISNAITFGWLFSNRHQLALYLLCNLCVCVCVCCSFIGQQTQILGSTILQVLGQAVACQAAIGLTGNTWTIDGRSCKNEM